MNVTRSSLGQQRRALAAHAEGHAAAPDAGEDAQAAAGQGRRQQDARAGHGRAVQEPARLRRRLPQGAVARAARDARGVLQTRRGLAALAARGLLHQVHGQVPAEAAHGQAPPRGRAQGELTQSPAGAELRQPREACRAAAAAGLLSGRQAGRDAGAGDQRHRPTQSQGVDGASLRRESELSQAQSGGLSQDAEGTGAAAAGVRLGDQRAESELQREQRTILRAAGPARDRGLGEAQEHAGAGYGRRSSWRQRSRPEGGHEGAAGQVPGQELEQNQYRVCVKPLDDAIHDLVYLKQDEEEVWVEPVWHDPSSRHREAVDPAFSELPVPHSPLAPPAWGSTAIPALALFPTTPLLTLEQKLEQRTRLENERKDLLERLQRNQEALDALELETWSMQMLQQQELARVAQQASDKQLAIRMAEEEEIQLKLLREYEEAQEEQPWSWA
ncbi:hypothetical protein ON010_g1025 [Phytophthora cinnamomi]|nr:hypothetical protein ON010_g1025 [Phytophthora cinnamomi]